MRCRVGHPRGDHVTGTDREVSRILSGKPHVHQPIVCGTTSYPFGPAVFSPLALTDEHFDTASEEFPIGLPRDLVHHIHQATVTLAHDIGWYLIGHIRCRRPRPR